MPRVEEQAEYADVVDNAKRTKHIKNTIFGIGIGSLFQPLQVSKVLIQLGYEPWPLEKGRAWGVFGAEKRFLPNTFVYAKRIYSEYGFSMVYRGVSASICGNFIGALASVYTEEHLAKYYGMDEPLVVPKEHEYVDSKKFIRRLARGSLSKTAGIIVARPFQVVMLRMIAQQIGGETIYRGVFGSLKQIYNEEGLPGLFSGLVPQIAGELCIYWTVSSISYLLDYLWKTYVEKEDRNEIDDEERVETNPPKTFKSVIQFAVPFVANSIFYPLQLVSTMMAVNGSGLVAGMPPFVPVYPTWQDCYHDLAAKDQLKRGAKSFFRFYEKPITYRFGEIYALPNA